MTDQAAFDNLKKEIRSILMPFQKGCDLFEFRKVYKEMLGRSIPAEKFGYRDDVDLLYDIPDVVWITQQGPTYQLMAVADETTQHIQKMVASQKPDSKKKRTVKGTRYNKFSMHPPRFVPKTTPAGRPSYRTSSTANIPSYTRPSSNGNTSSSIASRPPSVAYKFTSSASRPSSVASNSVPVASNSAVNRSSTVTSNTSPFVSRPSVTASNSSSFANNFSQAVSRPSPTVSRPPSAASNSSSFMANPSQAVSRPVVSNQESIPAASNPALDRGPAAASSKPAASFSYSRKFQRDLPPRFRAASSTKLLPLEVECRIVDVVKKYSTGLQMRDFFLAYQRQYNQQFAFENYGFGTLQECLETIPDLSMKPLSNNNFTICYNGGMAEESGTNFQKTSGTSASGKLFGLDSCAEPAPAFMKAKTSEIFKFNGSWANPPNGQTHAQSGTFQGQNQNGGSFNREPAYNFQDLPQANGKSQYYENNAVFKTSSPEDEHRAPKSKADALDTFELKDTKTSSLGLTENMKNKFRKIISRNNHGIYAKDFPTIYEEVTGSRFDLHSLGFNDLAGLVDSLPDIFRRKRVAGSRKDWIIAPAGSSEEEEGPDAGDCSPKVGALLIDCCIQSIRKILQGCPEGIPLNDFLHMYSINCNEPLYIADLGFDCIENFLLSISSRVPLKIELEKGCKTIFLDGSGEVIEDPVVAILGEELPEAIPFDASSPDCRYKKLDLPLDIGTSKFVPVYTSEIINPGHLFIQLISENTSDALNELSEEIEQFYNGPHSQHYLLHDRYLKEGAMCASLWPKDKLWYRALIRSVVSADSVWVFYVDYGTSDVVPRNMLRYLKEPFAKLPAQAVKASLAYVYPPNKLPNWSPESKKRMLKLCQDVPLMAKVEDIQDGVLSIILCDTSGNKDLFINDTLIEEGLAARDNPEPPPPQPPVYDPVQVMQAQCYYQMQNTLSLTMPPEDVAKTMQALSLVYPSNPLVPKSPGGAVSQSPYQPAADAYQSYPGAAAYQPTSQVTPYPSFSEAAAYQLPLGVAPAYQSPSRASAYQSASGTTAAYQSPSGQQSGSSSGKASNESSVDESDVFQDDEDLFNEFLEKSSIVSKRYVKRIRTDDGYFFHILIVDGRPYVSSGDISILIWSDKEPDHLLKRLQSRDDIVFQSLSISEEGNEEMFNQFEKFYVKGIQKGGKIAYINIYPLQSAIAILNVYGHPSVELRQQIRNEIESFNPNLPAWQELSEMEIPEEEEAAFRAVTDDDKLRRLCIYDLLTMRDGIRIKKNSLIRDLTGEHHQPILVDKLEKLENLLQRVELRITKIRMICSTFS